ncbi:MAG: aminopeptidase P family protein [Gammaproteobacteria bacterium]|nr:Xaa-Pro peptidase family protein [Gammaproteobacteria bacterium]MXY65728.1 aminopeptidase P family protein [Gammaproteobacteria bacterium]MYG65830.1 aminopeptidase P family protein [Gammaproteobacteria bacterium]
MTNPLDISRPIDETAVRRYRLDRVRSLAAREDVAAVLLFDPINIRYANGSRNMQVWTMHNFCRYALILTAGPSVMFELPTGMHLLEGLETIDEVRTAWSTDYFVIGYRTTEIAANWASEIGDLVRQHGGGNRRLAVDRLDVDTAAALTGAGLELMDGKKVMEHARAIKSLEEIRALRFSLSTCDAAMRELKERATPGMTEQEALSVLLAGSVRRGGEYPETRLMTSGPRTNPWFQETGDRIMADGDFLSFDTDLVGPMGFYNDISRSWIVGDARPTDGQRRLYAVSRAQLETNIALLVPGMSFLEYASRTYRLPEEYLANRYADVGHGCGLGVEYPFLWYPEDEKYGAYDGVFAENMVVCIESYVGAVGGREGVKLEQPVWLSPDGPVVLSDYPLEDDLG